ncbi:hypothetical protein [Phenylobacterium sp.]|uniref:hypothetical protein n=1 Tax=Phenylobacterium sp. TaxID=1871053 RepID=UPI002735F2D1|nr:hypothetical protein [Phenylobacterium sp.]MDP3855619.1 hypothetical protein [Phenylobacterium sp.]
MGQNKTQPTQADVEAFLGAVAPPARQAEARAVCEIMALVSEEFVAESLAHMRRAYP